MKNKILLALVTVFLVDANAKDLPPVELLSRDTNQLQESLDKDSQRWLPMKPDPTVTRIVLNI